MLAAVLALVLGCSQAAPCQAGRPPPLVVAAAVPSTLRDALMAKYNAMNDGDQGIFHDDVTPLVASYFPKGQTFAETQRMIEDQKLGPLMPFKGRYDRGKGRMYVSMFSVMTQMFSSASVVVDFDFSGTSERTMVLTNVSAYLQATNM